MKFLCTPFFPFNITSPKEWKTQTKKAGCVTNQKTAVRIDSCCQSNGRPSRSQQTHYYLGSARYSWPSPCHCLTILSQWYNAPVGSRRSVQLACLQLPHTPQFCSCLGSGSLQGALQGWRGKCFSLLIERRDIDRHLPQSQIWWYELLWHRTVFT
jgi:hypothetical protein